MEAPRSRACRVCPSCSPGPRPSRRSSTGTTRPRLHFIPTGLREADFRDFDLVLDALAETYDFIVLLAPAFPQSEIAKVMAPYADMVVLASDATADAVAVAAIEGELMEAGARDVLLTGHAGAPAGRVRAVA